jgi:hypothetical protein
MNTSSRIFMSALSPFITLLVLTASSPGSAQDARGTVKNDSLQVYSEMSTDSEGVATLAHGTAVHVNLSVTNGEGSWCSVSGIDASARLGFVRCDGLERENTPSTAGSVGGGATPPLNPGSQIPTHAQKA